MFIFKGVSININTEARQVNYGSFVMQFAVEQKLLKPGGEDEAQVYLSI